MALRFPIATASYCLHDAINVRSAVVDDWAGIFSAPLPGCRYPNTTASSTSSWFGVVCAPLADENLRRSLMLFDNNGLGFFARQYVGYVLIAVIVFVFIEGIRCGRRTRRKAAARPRARAGA